MMKKHPVERKPLSGLETPSDTSTGEVVEGAHSAQQSLRDRALAVRTYVATHQREAALGVACTVAATGCICAKYGMCTTS